MKCPQFWLLSAGCILNWASAYAIIGVILWVEFMQDSYMATANIHNFQEFVRCDIELSGNSAYLPLITLRTCVWNSFVVPFKFIFCKSVSPNHVCVILEHISMIFYHPWGTAKQLMSETLHRIPYIGFPSKRSRKCFPLRNVSSIRLFVISFQTLVWFGAEIMIGGYYGSFSGALPAIVTAGFCTSPI